MGARPSSVGRKPLAVMVAIAAIASLVFVGGEAVAPRSALAAQPGEVVHRVNVGGGEVAGSPVWSADSAGSPSAFRVTAANLSSTGASIDVSDSSLPVGTPAALFSTQRWDPAGGSEMQWSFPVLAGAYEVRLFFSENYAPFASPAGQRVFDVQAEGQTFLDNVDVAAQAGAINKGIMRSFEVSSDGMLDLTFLHQANNPMVSAIEIVGAQPVAPGEVVHRVNVGGGEVAGSPVWSADSAGSPSAFRVTAANLSSTGASIDVSDSSLPVGTPAALFSTQRWDPAGGSEMQWSFPVLAGAYEVRLFFSENYAPFASPAGQRVFDVQAEGQTFLDNVDVAAQAGAINKGIMRSFEVSSDGMLDLTFLHQANNPMVSAIEIVGAQPVAPGEVVHRVNVGGGEVAGSPVWSADSAGSPSAFRVTAANLSSTGASIDVSDSSLPVGTPAALFSTQRWDPAGGSEMQWSFPVLAGAYEVRLFFSENYAPFASPAGQRVFDVQAEGQTFLDNVDVAAQAGAINKGIMRSFEVSSDGMLDLTFLHQANNPMVSAIEIVGAQPVAPGEVVHRVNVGGGEVAGSPVWSADSAGSPSAFRVTAANLSSTGASIDVSDSSLPVGTPAALFSTQRWDPAGGSEMQWSFPVLAGAYEVRLFFSENYAPFASPAGQRVFDVQAEGQTFLDNVDVAAQAGAINKGIMRSFEVSSDGMLDLTFLHQANNPMVSAIEIVGADRRPDAQLSLDTSSVAFADTADGDTSTETVTVTNTAEAGAKSLTLSGTTISGSDADQFSDTFDDLTPVVLAPGESTTIDVTFAPTSTGAKSASLEIANDGPDGPASVALSGTGTEAVTPGEVLFRVNVGGPTLTGTPDWSGDPFSAPSPYVTTATNFYSDNTAIDMTHPSLPAGTPAQMFQTQRYDVGGGDEMQWSFPVAPGQYEVRLYLAEIYGPYATPGSRVFDVQAEGVTVLDDLDVAAEAGAAFKGIMRSVTVDADTSIDLTFLHQVENPMLEGIEILTTDGSGTISPSLGTSPSQVNFPVTAVGDTSTQSVSLTNTGANGASDLHVTAATITGTDAGEFSVDLPSPITLAVGESTTLDVAFNPTVSGTATAALELTHDGSNPTVSIPLSGTAPSGDGATVLFRVNAGGPSVAGDPVWAEDSQANPSPYADAGTDAFDSGQTVDISDPSIPAGTPASIFSTERYDGSGYSWHFPTGAGDYQVRLYFAETSGGQASVGARVMDVSVEGVLELDDFDQYAEAGAMNRGLMRAIDVTAVAEAGDAQPDIDITLDSVVNVPALKAVEIVIPPVLDPTTVGANPVSIAFGNTELGQTQTRTVTLTHLGPPGADPVTITGATILGPWAEDFGENFDEANPPTLQPGDTTTIDVTHQPGTTGLDNVTLQVTTTGANSPIDIPITGNGVYGATGSGISFGKSTISGLDGPQSSPTSLKWGPDDRLYVTRLDGTIQVATITRNGPNDFTATAVETITSIRDLPNHDDDGSTSGLTGRMVTGIEVLGTAQNPIIYLVSSDPRIGSPQSPESMMDTNSGILSRLEWNGSTWVKRDLLRGLPRSKEQHSVQGVIHDPVTGHLLLMSGGNTNNGAPSGNFKNLPEYALTSAILDVDVAALEALPGTYDLPTLDDEDRPGVNDANDPFGGNNGKNQAILEPSGPVQLYATGFRNAYDAVLTPTGLYTIDNGGNAGWGGAPANEGPNGQCLNTIDNGGQTYQDGLHQITGPGYYGGHPNPTRGNTANTFNATNPQSPVSVADPIECDFRDNDSRGALAHFSTSTNGVAQYTTDNFGGALQGNLIAAGWDNMVHRIELNADGSAAKTSQLFQNVGAYVLDVIASPASAPFPGTILAADYGTSSIYIYEPTDIVCTGTYSTGLDDDGDGFSNADEVDNGTNPCSAGDIPADFDDDQLSNLNDPDDDNDTNPDVTDRFAVDDTDGLGQSIPVDFPWDSDTPQNSGILNLGITGSMINGSTDWLSTYDPNNMTIIGAAGVVTVDATPNGDALGAQNDQQYGLQVGFDARPANANTFEASTSLPNPFGSHAPLAGHSWGLQVGTGTQSDYMKIVASGDNGGEMQLVLETGDVATTLATAAVAMPGPERIDVYLRVDPDTAMAQASYAVTASGVVGPKTPLGDPFAVPATWFDQGMAAGLIATSGGAASPLTASWDFLKVLDSPGTITTPVPPAEPVWSDLADTPLSIEALSNVELDGYMYLAGGGCQSDGGKAAGCTGFHRRYDPATDTYTTLAALPANIGHMQAVTTGGKIYYIGGLGLADDLEVATVYVYDPATNTFSTGTPMPAGRVRGNPGVAVHDGKIYVAGGLKGPHFSPPGAGSALFDEYDPATGTWTTLANLPGMRDHAMATVVGDKLYLLDGRISIQGMEALVQRTDVYDFTTGTWSSTAAPIPTARAAAAIAAVGTEIWVMGGETEPSIRAEVEVYDTLTDTWRTEADMPTPRHGEQASVCNNGIYTFAGSTAPYYNPTAASALLALPGFGPCPKP